MVVPLRVVLAAFALGIAVPAFAQDPQPEPRVPSLTPREFEIRGDVRVALPQIERQPLSGFGPPPRTYVVPANRVAVTGAYDPDLDELPSIALAQPFLPKDELLIPKNIRVEATYGTQSGRTGRLDVGLPVASGRFLADVDYDGIGSVSDNETVGFDRLRADARVRTGGNVQFELYATGATDRYGVPGVRSEQNLTRTPVRRLSRLGGGFGLESTGATPFVLQAHYSADRLNPEVVGGSTTLGADQSAGVVGATGEVTLFDRFRIDAGAGTIGLDGGLGEDVQYAAAGGALVLGSSGGVELSLGARALTYQVAVNVGDGYANAISPIVDLSIPAGPTVRLFASNDPILVTRGLGDHFQINPFASAQPVLAPDVLQINARAGAEVTNGRVRIRGFAHYVEAPTWLIFERSGDGLFVEGYESVRIQGVTAEATLVSRSGISFEAGVTVRESEIDDNGGIIPFFPPNTIRASIQIPFSRGRVGFTAYRESERPADRADLSQASPFAMISADARFDITRSVAIVGQADRLAGRVEEWPGYQLPGTTVRAGLRVTL